MKYIAKFPITAYMSPISYVVTDDSHSESKEENALWHYNKSREHDGLRPLEHLPRGTTFTRMEEETTIPFHG